MERVGALISIAAASCFVCSAAFIFGRLSGLGATELTWYLTFTDFVNLAPATLMIIGIIVGIMSVNDSRVRTALDTRTPGALSWWLPLIFGSVCIILMIAVAIWVPAFRRPAVTSLALCPLFVFASRAIRTKLAPRFGTLVANSVDSMFAAIFMCFVFGYMFGFLQFMRTDTVTVCTSNGETTGKSPMAIDRGLAFVEQNKFVLISWTEIKWTDYALERDASAKPRACK